MACPCLALDRGSLTSKHRQSPPSVGPSTLSSFLPLGFLPIPHLTSRPLQSTFFFFFFCHFLFRFLPLSPFPSVSRPSSPARQVSNRRGGKVENQVTRAQRGQDDSTPSCPILRLFSCPVLEGLRYSVRRRHTLSSLASCSCKSVLHAGATGVPIQLLFSFPPILFSLYRLYCLSFFIFFFLFSFILSRQPILLIKAPAYSLIIPLCRFTHVGRLPLPQVNLGHSLRHAEEQVF